MMEYSNNICSSQILLRVCLCFCVVATHKSLKSLIFWHLTVMPSIRGPFRWQHKYNTTLNHVKILQKMNSFTARLYVQKEHLPTLPSLWLRYINPEDDLAILSGDEAKLVFASIALLEWLVASAAQCITNTNIDHFLYTKFISLDR